MSKVKAVSSAAPKSKTSAAPAKTAAKSPAKAVAKVATKTPAAVVKKTVEKVVAATPAPKMTNEVKTSGASLTLNGKKYFLANFSNEAKLHLELVRFADAELKRLNRQTAITKTALSFHKNALIAALPAAAE